MILQYFDVKGPVFMRDSRFVLQSDHDYDRAVAQRLLVEVIEKETSEIVYTGYISAFPLYGLFRESRTGLCQSHPRV